MAVPPDYLKGFLRGFETVMYNALNPKPLSHLDEHGPVINVNHLLRGHLSNV